ncbi:MAG: hypothetical protein L6Q74_11830 [Sphaerotilus natans subsp. sulfidivorans]|uniref:hypothetical protein n=1 Tax=Sphaerotilus sulfidivorans TaxID=639200 RepID=UPI0023556553|nr:hypothetical protein [Sphaerotilus sulfidivorans]MCK6402571.1 hypothetical protein [Sphaerotilus sulfidivorans]
MSHVIHQLANIPLKESTLDQLELNKVFENFARNYKKLDDLKNFRSEYEQRNFLSRWWDNDKLRDAQLDSAEVQAEFSKTLGQLVAISVIQAKELNEQQRRISNQQHIINDQVATLHEHAKELTNQHHIQEDQAKKLKQVVADYMVVKGISDEQLHRLALIVSEIDKTKEEFFDESRRVNEQLSAQLRILEYKLQSTAEKIYEKILENTESIKNSIDSKNQTQDKTNELVSENINALSDSQAKIKEHIEKLNESTKIGIELLDKKTDSKIHRAEELMSAKYSKIEAIEQKTISQNEHIASLESTTKNIAASSFNTNIAIADINENIIRTNKRLQNYLIISCIGICTAISAIGLVLIKT